MVPAKISPRLRLAQGILEFARRLRGDLIAMIPFHRCTVPNLTQGYAEKSEIVKAPAREWSERGRRDIDYKTRGVRVRERESNASTPSELNPCSASNALSEIRSRLRAIRRLLLRRLLSSADLRRHLRSRELSRDGLLVAFRTPGRKFRTQSVRYSGSAGLLNSTVSLMLPCPNCGKLAA